MATATVNNENNSTEKVLANICTDTGLLTNTYDRSDPFGSESNGTAKFIGPSGGGGCANPGTIGSGCSSGNSGGNNSKFDFYTMKASNNNQRIVRNELPKNELIKMLCYLEGELQARDIVIAALRNERVKQLITNLRTKPMNLNDPHSALFRDKIAASGNLVSRQSSTTVLQAEMEVRAIIEQQMESLYQMVTKQRSTQVRMVSILTESLENNQRMRQELEEEKRKHEHDTAQGDDITYGLEMERTKLKQELETERTQRKKLEKDLKKLQETLDFERNRQKQIVLLLIAERKKILMKYIEEGKRSEDLAQILSEEKLRSDTIAEGLEEESKKSLQMEAELEKQTAAFDNERKTMKINLSKDEKRIKELEAEVLQLKNEIDVLKKQNSVTMRMQASHNVPVPIIPVKMRTISGDDVGVSSSSMVNVAKIVQPTATVSSVPVSGPTTGIARSISPGQSLRQQAIIPNETLNQPANAPVPPAGINFNTPPPKALLPQQQQHHGGGNPAIVSSTSYMLSSSSTATILRGPPQSSVNAPVVVVATSQSALPQAVNNITLSSTSSILTGTNSATAITTGAILNISTTVTSSTIGTAPIPLNTNHPIAIAGTVVNANPPIAVTATAITTTRGVPPPIPPNKPVVPPKREPSLSRLGSIAANNAK